MPAVSIRRILRRLCIAFAAVIGLVVLMVSGLIAYASVDHVDGFFVRSATLADPQFLYSLAREEYHSRRAAGRYHVNAHRLQPGRGTIFAYRFYSPGTLAIDDEHYRKLTLWLPPRSLDSTLELPIATEGGPLVIYGRGGSAWPDIGCAGFIESGSVRIERVRRHYRVRVVGEMVPVQFPERAGFCTPQHIDLAFDAVERNWSSVNAWLGAKGDHPYEETYRHGIP